MLRCTMNVVKGATKRRRKKKALYNHIPKKRLAGADGGGREGGGGPLSLAMRVFRKQRFTGPSKGEKKGLGLLET